MKTQNYSYSQSLNIPQPTSNSVKFNDQPQLLQDQSKNYPFFQQNKNNTTRYQTRNQPPHFTAKHSPSNDDEFYNQNHQRFFFQIKDLVLTILISQTISNHTNETNKYDRLEIIQHHIIKNFFHQKTQSLNNLTDQLKCIKKFHYHVIYNNMK